MLDSRDTPPILVAASMSPGAVNTDTVNIGSERKADDLLSIRVSAQAKISSSPAIRPVFVRAVMIRESNSSPLQSANLVDDGSTPDSVAGDGFYSGIMNFSFQRSAVGTLRLELSATSNSGLQSNTIILPFLIFRANQPPALSNLQSPDTVRISSQTQSILLTVKASDLDGSADIRQVVFNSFLPDGRASTGNPFRMFDDGTNGDTAAGDGVYSLRVLSPTTTGPYRFEFQAADRSGALSNTIVHTIVVIP